MFPGNFPDFERIFPKLSTRCMERLRPGLNDPGSSGLCPVKDDRNPRLDDPGLLSCDLLHRVSQVCRVVQADGGDHCDSRVLHRIGGVQSSPQPGLQDDILHICLGKSQHGHPEKELKIRRMGDAVRCHPIHCLFHLLKHGEKSCIIYLFPVHHDPLIQGYQMGGRKKSCPSPHLQEHRLHVGTDGPLPIGSRHMDDLSVHPRVSHSFQKVTYIGQGMLLCKFRYLFYISNSLLIGHFYSSSSPFATTQDTPSWSALPVPGTFVSVPSW